MSELLLDIEGAFPNANPERLVHNLQKRRVPIKYANFVWSMFTGRITVLKFDRFASEHTTTVSQHQVFASLEAGFAAIMHLRTNSKANFGLSSTRKGVGIFDIIVVRVEDASKHGCILVE